MQYRRNTIIPIRSSNNNFVSLSKHSTILKQLTAKIICRNSLTINI